ncbi:hypothetical protein JCM11491_001011 [Sporobolomyces phaffii]
MPYSDSDPGSPPPLESVLPDDSAVYDRSLLDFTTVSTHSALEKLRSMRKQEDAIEVKIRRLEKQLAHVEREQTILEDLNPDAHLYRRQRGRNVGGPRARPSEPVEKPKLSDDSNPFHILPRYEAALTCPPHRCNGDGEGPGGAGGFDEDETTELDQMITSIFDLALGGHFTRLVRKLVGEALPYKGAAASVDLDLDPEDRPGGYTVVCAFLADLVPTVFADALGQINAAMTKVPDFDTPLMYGDVCICQLSHHVDVLRALRNRLAMTVNANLVARVTNARALDISSWIKWIETQHTLGRFGLALQSAFDLDASGQTWQRKVSKSLSLIQSEWEQALALVDQTTLIEPMLHAFEWIGGLQLFEEAKRWRADKTSDAKTNCSLHVGAWSLLFVLPYGTDEVDRVDQDSADYIKKLGDLCSKTDVRKASEYYDVASLLSLPLMTARTNAALMRLQHDAPDEYERVISDCTQVLYFETQNWKALFRRGRAYAALGWYRYALTDLEAASKLEPTNTDLRAEKERLVSIWAGLVLDGEL